MALQILVEFWHHLQMNRRPGSMDISERKNPSMASFRRKVKPWVLCRTFTDVKEPQTKICQAFHAQLRKRC